MKHATSRELFAYWNRMRRGEPAPWRSSIEPADIRHILADTFILEVIDRDLYQVRLAGTRICSLYGREIKGSDFLDLWQQDDRQAMATLAAAVAGDGAASVVTVDGRTGRNHGVLCELLLLPLRHSGPAFDRILGSFAAIDRPYWLGTEPIARQTVASLRLIWPDEQPHFMRRASDRGEELTAPMAPIPFPDEKRRKRGHLFVVEGGKH